MFRLICQKTHAALVALRADQRGASAIEYSIIAAMVVIGLVAFVTPIREALVEIFTQIQEALESI
ncbi:Flp family type IVb pilin [Guyparkeria sp.]|uniref:Flp family type IVb pilin n=1 Tax=Guyparkeria sp. TaxID=2035736 RepID=UPI0039708A34